jgi:SAM-dependent methyltransferase
VLDIGSGTGYFVQYYLDQQAASVTGVDITDVSVERLRRKFPQQVFKKMDISLEQSGFQPSFDIVNVFDVLYHIVSDQGFAHAISFICKGCKPGAWILVTDGLNPDLSRSEHVRYRSLETYRRAFEQEGAAVKDLRPVFCRMGTASVRYDQAHFLSRVAAKLVDSAAPLYYLADRISCPKERSSLSLLVCQKQ